MYLFDEDTEGVQTMRMCKYALMILAVLIFHLQTLQAADISEMLVDTLVAKGIVTPEQAAAIRAETAIKTQEENAQKKKSPVQGSSKIEMGGYIQVQCVDDDSAGRFGEMRIRRARLDLQGDAGASIGWRLQIDAVQPLKSLVQAVKQDSASKKVTAANTKAVVKSILLDAYLDYRFHPLLNARVGQFRVPFGRENIESDAMMDFINRSQVTERLVPGRDNGSQGRDIGGQFFGDSKFGKERKLAEYSVGVFDGAGINTGEDNHEKDIGGRVVGYPLECLSIGASYYSGKTGASLAEKRRTGGEFVLSLYNASLKGEYVTGNDSIVDKYGWYAQVSYKVKLLSVEFEPGVRYDAFDPDEKKKLDRTDVITPGLNCYLAKRAKIQINYEVKREEDKQNRNNVFWTQFQVQF